MTSLNFRLNNFFLINQDEISDDGCNTSGPSRWREKGRSVSGPLRFVHDYRPDRRGQVTVSEDGPALM